MGRGAEKQNAASFEAAFAWCGRFSAARRNLQLGSDVHGDFARIEVDEVADTVEWDAPQLGPLPQRPDRRRLSLRKDAAMTKADDVRQPVFCE